MKRNTRKQRRRKQRRQSRRRGGRRLGRGVSGIVYSPVLACADSSEAPYAAGPGFVGKAIPEKYVAQEMMHADALKAYSDIIIAPLHSCKLHANQSNAHFLKNRNDETDVYENNEELMGERKIYSHQIIFANGGQTVSTALQGRKKHKAVFTALKEFLPKLVDFNKHFVHYDLHLENLVFDGQHIRMIDLGKLEPVTEDNAHVDMRTLFFTISAALTNYSYKNECDATYKKWLDEYTVLFRTGSTKELIDAMNAIPAVNAPTTCSIMG